MRKIFLGKSNLKVSQLGLGCINFGSKTSESDSFELLDTYIENGGNFIDTANNYAVWAGGNGKQSEETIGKWISARKNRKDYILIVLYYIMAVFIRPNIGLYPVFLFIYLL